MRKALLVTALGLCLSAAACAPGYYGQGRRLAESGDPQQAVEMFYQEIEANPTSQRAWRELGVAFYDMGDLDRSEEALKQAAAIETDARTHLYLGLVYEAQNQPEQALRAYRVALGHEPGGSTRDMLEGRVHYLVQEKLQREVKAALASERDLGAADVPENTVAVVAFNGDELPPELAPLAKGMAEFTAQDLGKISSLKLVDRLKIDAIRKELKLSQSELADPATAPRIGKLVGGRRIVTGTMLGVGDDAIRLNGAVVNTQDASVITPGAESGKLDEFFRVQKAFVFEVVKAMGITLTPEERSAIEEVPTENFLALMAYCRGLDLQDRNDLAGARAEFNSASAMDHGFSQAATQAGSISSILSSGAAGGSITQFSGQAVAAAEADLVVEAVGSFNVTVAGWNGFVPTGAEIRQLGEFVDIPPRARFLSQQTVIIRGTLDVRP